MHRFLPDRRQKTNYTTDPEDVQTRGSSNLGVYGIVFVAAFASSAYQAFSLPGAALGKYLEVVEVARNLAATGGFANPFSTLATGPTAIVPPLYPAFLAGLIKLFGVGPNFAMAALLATILVHSLHAALLPRVALLFFGSIGPGVWAAALSIVLPLYRVTPQSETMYFALALMAFCVHSDALLKRASGNSWRAIATGVYAGLLLLLNPASVCVAVPWIVFLSAKRTASFVPRARLLLLFALTAFITCLPWILRNYVQLGAITFIRDGLGLELYVSNNDLSEASMAQNLRESYHITHPSVSIAEAKLVRDMGEAEYFQAKKHQALEWIKNNPLRFSMLTLRRVAQFWFCVPFDFIGPAVAVWVLTGLSLPSVILMVRRRVRVVSFILAVFLVFPLVYYFVQSSVHFRYPILWVSLLAAGYLIHDLFGVAEGLTRRIRVSSL